MFGAGGVPVCVGDADCILPERVEVSIVVLAICVVALVEVDLLGMVEVRLRVMVPVVLGEAVDVLLGCAEAGPVVVDVDVPRDWFPDVLVVVVVLEG